MRKLIFIFLLAQVTTNKTLSQSFTVNDLIKLSSLPSNDIDRFMGKSGYILTSGKIQDDVMEAGFTLKPRLKKNYSGPTRSIEVKFKADQKIYILHTSSLNEFTQGRELLNKNEFFYDAAKSITADLPILFQKGNIAVQTFAATDSITQYTFVLTARRIPDHIKYAEDLLQFDSHEFLVSFFGEDNIKKDMYYFSEKELQKCSVLFSGTPYQVVFVWGNGNDLDSLLYIIVPHSLPTVSASKENAFTGNNQWELKNGIYPGMNVKELLRLNQGDFDIYGNKSELAYMVKPKGNGKIDFKKTAVTLNCASCDELKIFNQEEVSAIEVTKKDIPMYVNEVILYPSN